MLRRSCGLKGMVRSGEEGKKGVEVKQLWPWWNCGCAWWVGKFGRLLNGKNGVCLVW